MTILEAGDDTHSDLKSAGLFEAVGPSPSRLFFFSSYDVATFCPSGGQLSSDTIAKLVTALALKKGAGLTHL